MEHVAGIMVFNDLTAREVQRREQASGTRFWTAKNMPGFGPVGPFLVTLDEVGAIDDLWLTCAVNGESRIRFNTSEMIFKVPDIIEHFSRYLPLDVGDTFSTGAPGGVAVAGDGAENLYLKPGDVVDVGIESLLRLRTHVV
jgi:2-keto-4-pentenoate hydratase/2-oxohepta-3-ene-1,7-dioic acid hydratase in catechol pathway